MSGSAMSSFTVCMTLSSMAQLQQQRHAELHLFSLILFRSSQDQITPNTSHSACEDPLQDLPHTLEALTQE